MANPKSSASNKSKGKGNHNRQSQQHSQQQQQVDPSKQSQLTPAPVATTGLESPTATPLATHPSEDTLALAAAVAASIPAAPLTRPAPERRPSTPTVVTTTSDNPPETSAAENEPTSRTASAAVTPSENRRGLFQRFFGWSS
ncbi:mucin-2 [Drosophila suzukii]|uniref:Mucin-2 n=1 Tax=Drosophila suzukii TaxID=28584 RepID=A0AB39ZJ27_DROSZ|nr:mucin-2 [Drosophila suzukii]